MTTIVWFRQDLRVSDNPALLRACDRGPVVPVYIVDETGGLRAPGGASKWWLHHSLASLRADLGAMVFARGDPLDQLRQLIEQTGATAVYWNRCYEPAAIARDRLVKTALRDAGLEVRSFNAGLLNEPWEIATGAGQPFKVYSPFWRAAAAREQQGPLPPARPAVERRSGLGCSLAAQELLPAGADWAAGWPALWQPGEAAARSRLEAFIETGLGGYATLRDRPDLENVSRLSPHLHFGEISPRQVHARLGFLSESHPRLQRDIDKFLAEIGWREFSHHLLYHFPTLPTQNWRPAFDSYPWRDSKTDLLAWQRGRTGYPLVDAGMRELWQTGYMHNRVRMVAASFLVKHLRLHWRLGENWFWDTLVDADLANNSAGWQWVAGSGADASPYFRIFNPVTQGRKFDPDGNYVRRWCPELSRLDNNAIHAPSEQPQEVLRAAGVELGTTYPAPIVDHATARAEALAGYEKVRKSAE